MAAPYRDTGMVSLALDSGKSKAMAGVFNYFWVRACGRVCRWMSTLIAIPHETRTTYDVHGWVEMVSRCLPRSYQA